MGGGGGGWQVGVSLHNCASVPLRHSRIRLFGWWVLAGGGRWSVKVSGGSGV